MADQSSHAAFEILDQALGENEYAAAVAPIRMVTLGGLILVKMFKNRAGTVDIDVIIDPNIDAVAEFREAVLDCIQAVAQKQGLEKDWMNGEDPGGCIQGRQLHANLCFLVDQCKMFFQKGRVREKIFLQSLTYGEKIYSGTNLEIYAIRLKFALERKLRRLLDPTRDTAVDLADALCFLKHMASYGDKPLGFHQCQSLDYNEHGLPVPDEAIRRLQQTFEVNKENDPRIKDKQGIVDMVLDEERGWYYKDKHGQPVWVTWKLE